jgi:hypothetical protein
MHMIDIAVFVLFVYTVIVLTRRTEEDEEDRTVFMTILGLTLLYGIARQMGWITYGSGGVVQTNFRPINYSLSASRFGGGLRLGAS